MAPPKLTETQRENAFKGLSHLIKNDGWTQERMATAIGVTQQAMVPAWDGKVSQKVALFVAETLGVSFSELVNEGKLHPTDVELQRRARRVGTLPTWEAALRIAQEKYGELVPPWCWLRAGDFLVARLPQEITPEYVYDLAKAVFDQVPVAMRRAKATAEAKIAFDKLQRGAPNEISAKYSGESESTESQTIRRSSPPK